MKKYLYFLAVAWLFATCCHETKEDKYEEDEEILVNRRPTCEEETFYSIVYNNGWEDYHSYAYDDWKNASEEEKLKGIELGKELYAHHFYEIIDTTNMKFEHKASLERDLYLNPKSLHYALAYAYKNKKKLFLFYDHEGYFDFYIR